jgi:hypothetical protein
MWSQPCIGSGGLRHPCQEVAEDAGWRSCSGQPKRSHNSVPAAEAGALADRQQHTICSLQIGQESSAPGAAGAADIEDSPFSIEMREARDHVAEDAGWRSCSGQPKRSHNSVPAAEAGALAGTGELSPRSSRGGRYRRFAILY